MYSFVWFEKCLKVISTVKLFSSQRWNYVVTYRSSHQMCSVKKSVLRNFEKFTGKHLCQSIFFNKVAGLSPRLSPATLLKKRLWHRCFPVNFAKFLRTPFYRILPDDYFLYLIMLCSIILIQFSCLATVNASKNQKHQTKSSLAYVKRERTKPNFYDFNFLRRSCYFFL